MAKNVENCGEQLKKSKMVEMAIKMDKKRENNQIKQIVFSSKF